MSLPTLTLQRLTLSHFTTRYKYIAMFLKSTQSTLRSLTLSHCSLTDEYHFKCLLDLLWERFSLEECTLSSLNAGERGIYFRPILNMRPNTEEGHYHFDGFHDWVHVHKNLGWDSALELRTADGDDMKYWLQRTAEYATRGPQHGLTEYLH